MGGARAWLLDGEGTQRAGQLIGPDTALGRDLLDVLGEFLGENQVAVMTSWPARVPDGPLVCLGSARTLDAGRAPRR